MSKSASETKVVKKDEKEIPNQPIKSNVFEEDDYFEEFDEEGYAENNNQNEEDIDFKQWQEDWEDEEINDQFDKVLKREMELVTGNEMSN